MKQLGDRGVVEGGGGIDLVMLMGKPTTKHFCLEISQERDHLYNLDVYAIIIHMFKLIIK